MREEPMKMIMAYLQPHRLDRITRSLMHIEDFPGMTVVDGRGFGREKLEDVLSTREELTDFTPKVRIEIVVPVGLVESVIEVLVEGAHTGERGDGKIFVLPVEQAVRIKTKEAGEVAV
jgi:nitrogen regulatory protein PII